MTRTGYANVSEEELLTAVKRNYDDAEACYLELRARGWSETAIVELTGTFYRD